MEHGPERGNGCIINTFNNVKCYLKHSNTWEQKNVF